MFCSHAAGGLLVVGLCLLTVTGSVRVWQFYAMAAAFGLADAFLWPASGSIPPHLVQLDGLPAANALVATEEQAAMLAGPVLGGAALSAFTPAAVLAVAAATFSIAPLPRPHHAGAAVAAPAERTIRSLNITKGNTWVHPLRVRYTALRVSLRTRPWRWRGRQ